MIVSCCLFLFVKITNAEHQTYMKEQDIGWSDASQHYYSCIKDLSARRPSGWKCEHSSTCQVTSPCAWLPVQLYPYLDVIVATQFPILHT